MVKPNPDLWVLDLAKGTRSRLSFGGKNADNAVWSADGRTIYFSYTPNDGPMQIYQRPADGSRPQQAVIATQTDGVATDVSSDGKWLLYEEESAAAPGYGALKALPLIGEALKTGLVQHAAHDASDGGIGLLEVLRRAGVGLGLGVGRHQVVQHLVPLAARRRRGRLCGCGCGCGPFAHHGAKHVRSGELGRSRRGGRRVGQRGALGNTPPQVAHGLKRRQPLKQAIRMEVFELTEANRDPRAGEIDRQVGGEQCQHFVEIIAVYLDGFADAARPAAKIAGNQNAEGRIGLAPRLRLRVFGYVDVN